MPVRFIWRKPEVLRRLEQVTAHARVHAQRAGARARMFSLQLACLFVCAVSDLCCLLVITSPSEMTWSLQSSQTSLLQRAASVAFFFLRRSALLFFIIAHATAIHCMTNCRPRYNHSLQGGSNDAKLRRRRSWGA